jgi:hypothetical protein
MRNSTVAGIALTTLCATAICSRVSGALASEGLGLSLDDLRKQYHWYEPTKPLLLDSGVLLLLCMDGVR